MPLWCEKLVVPYFPQKKSNYCGAACAQMILGAIEVGNALPKQTVLYGEAQDIPGPFAFTNPASLAATLNAHAPVAPLFEGHFDATFETLAHTASAKIAGIIFSLRVPVAALVLGCAHWIVVTGVQTDAKPQHKKPYSIEAFWINNPGNAGAAARGPDEHVPFATWLSTYFNGCCLSFQPFIFVGDARPVESGSLRFHARRLAKRGGYLLDVASDMIEHARAGLRRFGLANAITDTVAGTPQLVQRLDKVDEYYYLVPFDRVDGTSAVVRIDAADGTYLGAQLSRQSYPTFDGEAVLQLLHGSVVTFDDQPVAVDRRTATLLPTLVWQPCDESRSPYAPFYQVGVAGYHFYADLDLRTYTTLDPIECPIPGR